tara:strand:- start:322 stop:969 length:648 start_codon:yes stop_codon:yes gene_type:complete
MDVGMWLREHKYASSFLATMLSLLLSHLLVAWLHKLRVRRINQKSLDLCTATSGGDPKAARIPITIISGFLGSGKTTLVNRILTGDHGKRVVVIENEFGAISIDHDLIDTARQAEAPEGTIVLKNGCMCCAGESPGSELERVLDQLLKMSELEGKCLSHLPTFAHFVTLPFFPCVSRGDCFFPCVHRWIVPFRLRDHRNVGSRRSRAHRAGALAS